MRVLMFGWEFPPHISGGLGTACLGITSALLERMIQVLFVVPHLFGDEDREKYNLLNASQIMDIHTSTNYRKFTCFRINSPLRPYASYPATSVKEALPAPERLMTGYKPARTSLYGPDLMTEVENYTRAASAISSEHEFDVIHAHDWMAFPAGMLAREISGKPLVVHVHATEFDRSGLKMNQEIFEVERKGMLAADRIITVSAYTKNILTERYRINPDKIEVVHNGIMPPTMFTGAPVKIKPGKKVVSFLGRITFQKGPDYFIEAARKVLDRLPDVHFVIAGSGDMLPSLIQRVAELRMATRFHFTGFVNADERDRLFSMSDVYVMPSVSEPFGLSTLEAIQAGVPVVISKQSGVTEVIANALKVDFWDTDALANAIFGLLQYPALARTFIRENKEELKGMGWNSAAEKLAGIYQSLV